MRSSGLVLLVVVVIITVILGTVTMFTTAYREANDDIIQLTNYKEVRCNSIVRYEDNTVVCQVQMQTEDENIRVFKENK